jgi:hypothetical protein
MHGLKGGHMVQGRLKADLRHGLPMRDMFTLFLHVIVILIPARSASSLIRIPCRFF